MYTVAFLVKRKAGMSIEAFLDYYRERHGPLMVSLIKDNGLISYEHFPLDVAAEDGRPSALEGPFDAISVYSFGSQEQAEQCWAMPEVIADGGAFIDLSTMLAMPVVRRMVFQSR